MSDFSLTEINDRISKASIFIDDLKKGMNSSILGQEELINKILIAILSNGHILLEGVPGLAKTLMVKTLSSLIKTEFQRIQFTPDMLPADLLGTLIYNQKTGEFDTRKGPIFSNIILADEINRSPAKVQSALLEAMNNKLINVDGEIKNLPSPFFVIASQNPINQIGTSPLPESQLDRFLMRISLGKPNRIAEKEILRGNNISTQDIEQIMSKKDLIFIQEESNNLKVSNEIYEYILDLISESRKLKDGGLSTRAAIAIVNASKACAYVQGQNYVLPDHVQFIFQSVAEHRLDNGFLESFSISNKILKEVDAIR